MEHRNGRFDLGQTASRSLVITQDLITEYAELTGDKNPIHIDENFAASSHFQGSIAHGMLVASLISNVLGNDLPGPGSIYLSQDLRFLAPVRPGDEVTAKVEVQKWEKENGRISLRTIVENQDGKMVIDGNAKLVMSSYL